MNDQFNPQKGLKRENIELWWQSPTYLLAINISTENEVKYQKNYDKLIIKLVNSFPTNFKQPRSIKNLCFLVEQKTACELENDNLIDKLNSAEEENNQE